MLNWCTETISEMVDGCASGLEYVREHKTTASILLLQIKIRTGKFCSVQGLAKCQLSLRKMI